MKYIFTVLFLFFALLVSKPAFAVDDCAAALKAAGDNLLDVPYNTMLCADYNQAQLCAVGACDSTFSRAADLWYYQAESAGRLMSNCDPSNLQPGDILFIRSRMDEFPRDDTKSCPESDRKCSYMGVTHVAMYMGNGKIAESTGGGKWTDRNYSEAYQNPNYLDQAYVGCSRPLAFADKSKLNCDPSNLNLTGGGGGDYGSTKDIDCPTLDLAGMSSGITCGLYGTCSGTSTTATSADSDFREEIKKAMEKGAQTANNVAKEEINKAPPEDILKGKGYCLGNMVSYFNAINALTTLSGMVQGMLQSILNQVLGGLCSSVQTGVNNLLSSVCIPMPGFSMPNLGLSNMSLDGCNSGVPLLTMSSGKSIPVPDLSGYFTPLKTSILNAAGK